MASYLVFLILFEFTCVFGKWRAPLASQKGFYWTGPKEGPFWREVTVITHYKLSSADPPNNLVLTTSLSYCALHQGFRGHICNTPYYSFPWCRVVEKWVRGPNLPLEKHSKTSLLSTLLFLISRALSTFTLNTAAGNISRDSDKDHFHLFGQTFFQQSRKFQN